MLIATNICKSFGQTPVLNGVSITAHAGDVIAMIGSSGSGKSTFLRCLNLLERPTSGEIAINGKALPLTKDKVGNLMLHDAVQLRTLRKKVAMVFQQFNLWSHMTAKENVMLGPKTVMGISDSEAAARAETYLERVGVAHRKDAYPAFMSGGEQQRVAIARALAMEPELLLFDEPTSALDPELVGEVLRVMRSLAEEGRTMIVVTHEMKFARDVASKVVFLSKGLIAEQGDPKQVLLRPQSGRLRLFLADQAA